MELTGFYRAIVTDTDVFEETGRIKTRISIFNNMFIEKDLLDDFNIDDFKKRVEGDSLTYILSPFGGGNNFGMFKLPQVNSVGLVSFIDGNPSMPVWVGGLNNILLTNSGSIAQLDIPSDDLESELSYFDYNTEKRTTTKNSSDKNSFVIRTKTNELVDFSNINSINWKENKTENGLVMNADHFEILHRKDDEVITTIRFDNEEAYDIGLEHKRKSGDSIVERSSLFLGATGMSAIIADSNRDIQVSITDKVEIIVDVSGKKTTITQSKDSVSIKSNTSTIELIQKASGNDEIILSSPVVRIDSKNILLGTGNDRIVKASGNFSQTLEDGTVLTASQNVRL